MNEILDFLKTHLGEASLPYYACHYILPGTVESIKNGVLEYSGRMLYVEYFAWEKRCKEELGNSSIVGFNWKGKKHQVIFLPCTKNASGSMKACFDHDGTWMHIIYDKRKKNNPFLVYCNFVMAGDEERTKENLEVLYIVEPKFLERKETL